MEGKDNDLIPIAFFFIEIMYDQLKLRKLRTVKVWFRKTV